MSCILHLILSCYDLSFGIRDPVVIRFIVAVGGFYKWVYLKLCDDVRMTM